MFVSMTAVLNNIVKAVSDADFEKDVVVFDYDNFDKDIKKYDHILVEFYMPTCPHCQHLLPAYHQAAQDLSKNDPPIPLGVANVLKYPAFWNKFDIKGTPALIWFEKGKRFDYTGTRESHNIVMWVKTHAASKETSTETTKDDTGKSGDDEKPKEVSHPPTFSDEALARIKQLKAILSDPKSTDEMKKQATESLNDMVLQGSDIKFASAEKKAEPSFDGESHNHVDPTHTGPGPQEFKRIASVQKFLFDAGAYINDEDKYDSFATTCL